MRSLEPNSWNSNSVRSLDVSVGGGSGRDTSSMVMSASGPWQNSHRHSTSTPSRTAARYTSREIPVLHTRWFQRKQPSHWRPCWRGRTGSLQAIQLMICADAMVVNLIVVVERELTWCVNGRDRMIEWSTFMFYCLLYMQVDRNLISVNLKRFDWCIY